MVSGDPSVLAVAPVMPTTLIRPLRGRRRRIGSTPGVSPPWARTTSPRTGAGVVVAVLDTGIDASHAAFAGSPW